MSRISGLEVFVQVVKQGSFTAAAEAVGVSRSHASKEVARLEARLSARLLQRTTRKVSLTDVGAAFYERTVSILEQLEESAQAVIEMQSVPVGNLRVAVPTSYGRMMLMPAINEFMTQHPRLTLDLVFADRRVDLVAEGVDLAVRVGHLSDSSLFARRIGAMDFVVCASPEYLDRHRPVEHPGQLRDHSCMEFSLRYDRGSWAFNGPDGPQKVRIDGNYRTDLGEALVDAAVHGLGIIYVPKFLAAAELERGRLQTVLDDWLPSAIPVWAIYPHNRHLSAKVRLLVDHLVNASIDPKSSCGAELGGR